jgi:predicted nucleic acid-binding protein
MTLIVDAGPLYSQADPNDPNHGPVVEVLSAETGPLVASAFAVAEADYLILRRLGIEAEHLFLRDLAEGTYLVECLTRPELALVHELAGRYLDLGLGIADLSTTVLARRHGTRRLLTLDERSFRAVTPLQGGHFTLLPADV